MTRILLRAAEIMLLLCGLAMSGSIVLGKMLPPIPLAVFMTMTFNNDLLISRVDTRLKVVSRERIANVSEFPYAIDSQCRILFPLRLSTTVRLAYLDLKTDERRSYASEYDPTGYAEWLPDKRRVWAQFTAGPERVRQYAIIDTVTGVSVNVPLYRLEPEAPVALTWSPDSAYGVIYGWRSMQTKYTYLLDTASGILTELEASSSHIFRWSPDSRYLVTLAAADLRVLDAQTLTQLRRFERIHYASGMAWTPDSHLLFLAQSPDAPRHYQGFSWLPATDTLAKNGINLPAANFSYSVMSDAWSPDGTKLFYEDRRSRVHILDTASGAEMANVSPPDKDGFRLHLWSPDSRYLVSYNDFPETLVFTDTNEKIYQQVTLEAATLTAFAAAWQTTPQPGLFERRTATLRRLDFGAGKPELMTEFTLPGAYLAAFCNPEAVP